MNEVSDALHGRLVEARVAKKPSAKCIESAPPGKRTEEYAVGVEDSAADPAPGDAPLASKVSDGEFVGAEFVTSGKKIARNRDNEKDGGHESERRSVEARGYDAGNRKDGQGQNDELRYGFFFQGMDGPADGV